MTPAFIYIYCICIEKQRKKKQKKKNRPLCRVLKTIHSAKWPSTGQHDSTLPSAKTLALGKVSNVCRVPGSSTRQSGHVAPPWAGTLPSARRRHSAKSLKLCRVSAVRHLAKCRPRLAPHGCFAECQGSRQSLCRVPEIRHSAKIPLPWEALPSGVCRV